MRDEPFDAAASPAPDASKDIQWYQYFGPFSILLLYFVALAFCKLCQGICKKCNPRQVEDSTNSPPDDRFIYDVSSDTLRRQSADLPPSYSSAGLSELADNVVVESGSERRRRHRRSPLLAHEDEETLPSYNEILEEDKIKFGEANTNPAYEEDEENKADLEEGDTISISSERNLPPPPPYRPPNL